MEVVTVRRVTRRLVPFLFVLYIANYLDRVNVSFAALQMNRDLGLSATAYGAGAGIFFVGYCLLQVPSNLLLLRVGARRWLSGLMIGWGVIATSMMFVRGPRSFFALRFLLGMVEAGFFPGVILYLANWIPAEARARAVARFATAVPVAGVIGGPVSGALLGLEGWGGFAGWQWLFFFEGVPSVLLGAIALQVLADKPEDATWLETEEKAWLTERLRKERSPTTVEGPGSLREALRASVVWRLGLLYFLIVFGLYGEGLWLPQVIKGSSSLSDLAVGFLTVAPAVASALAMAAIAAHSDRTGERWRHVAWPLVAGTVGFAAAALGRGSPGLATAALSLAAVGFLGAIGPFWSIPAGLFSGSAQAGAIAAINAVGNLAGFLGPYMIGVTRDLTASFAGALAMMAALMALGALLAWRLGRRPEFARLAAKR